MNHGFALAANAKVFRFEHFAGMTFGFATGQLFFVLDAFLANFGVLNFLECLSFRFQFTLFGFETFFGRDFLFVLFLELLGDDRGERLAVCRF